MSSVKYRFTAGHGGAIGSTTFKKGVEQEKVDGGRPVRCKFPAPGSSREILIATCHFFGAWSFRCQAECHERSKVEREGRTRGKARAGVTGGKGRVEENRRSLLFIDINMVCPLCQFLAAISETRFPARTRGGGRPTTSGKTEDVSVTAALVRFVILPTSSSLSSSLPVLFSFFFFLPPLARSLFSLQFSPAVGRFISSSVEISRGCIVEHGHRERENNGVHKFEKIVSATLQRRDKRDGG